MFAEISWQFLSRIPRRDLDLRALRALAHPLRYRLLYHLAFVGEANSTSVARAFGESTGSTSYHLRKLAEADLIEEVVPRSNGRERWWRLVPLDLRGIADADRSPEAEQLAKETSTFKFERDRDLVARFLANRARFPEWENATMFSSSATRLTPAELAEFTERYVELVKSYWRPPEECPPESEPVAVLFYAFPWPGE